MSKLDYSAEFLERLKQVKGKRAQIVIQHILEHGFITTEALETLYGYRHPPRAIRDVREQGISIESFSVKNKSGRTIAAYRFGEPEDVPQYDMGGRNNTPKALKNELLQKQNSRCAICNMTYEARYLQLDHRVPYLVGGENLNDVHDEKYMLVCASCNRAKSWSCEHCMNGVEHKKVNICKNCYWASPTQYEHIAMQSIRRVELIWTGEDISLYEALLTRSAAQKQSLSELILSLLRKRHTDDD
jgi:hypothetical protein